MEQDRTGKLFPDSLSKDIFKKLKESDPGSAARITSDPDGFMRCLSSASGPAMEAVLQRMGIVSEGKKVLVLGSGTLSGEIKALMERQGARCIAPEKKEEAEILIHAPSCGETPDFREKPTEAAECTQLSAVIDTVAEPLRTELILEALERGIPAEGGLFFRIAQIFRAAERLTGREPEKDRIHKAFEALLEERENIVLTGMPGAGKSLVGRIIAEETGRAFVDMDETLVSFAGKEITQIFSEEGETYFRDLETEITRRVSSRTGMVLSTGGGIILRPENVRALKKNGRLYFMDKAPEELMPSDDRPLSDTKEKVFELYRKRYALYCSTADERIEIRQEAKETARIILGRRHG